MKPTLQQIRAALAAATPGPWELQQYGAVFGGPVQEFKNGSGRQQIVSCCLAGTSGPEERDANAMLIANAPAWLAYLLDEIERRDALLRRYRESCYQHGRFNDGSECDCDLCREVAALEAP